MPYILALDQGTTSSRAVLVNERAEVVASAQKELTQHYPEPGWVEHDPEEIWSTQAGVIVEAMGRAGIDRTSIRGLGLTNQRESVVLWERSTGQPLHNAIVWQDRRTTQRCVELREQGYADPVRAKTGLELDPYFSATKIAWLLDHVPGARERARAGELACGTIDTWLIARLTDRGVHATDASNASRTMLFNIHSGAWDDELLALFDIPRAILPEIVPSCGTIGQVRSDLGLAGVPIAGIIGDQQSATMGQLCTTPGLAKNTYGTGCFLLMNTGHTPRPSTNRLLTTVAWQRDNTTTFALEGGTFAAGAIVQWLRDGLQIIRDASEIEPLARSVTDTGGVCIVPALAGLGPPHWDPDARGTILGITRGTTKAHIARAALEGIAMGVWDLASTMDRDGCPPLAELRVDGGAAASDLLMQFQADILGVPVVRPQNLETTALGAAFMAGLAVGIWNSTEQLEETRTPGTRFEPTMRDDERAAKQESWQKATERARGWA